MAKAHLEIDPATGRAYIWLDMSDTSGQCPDCGTDLRPVPCPDCETADLPDCLLCGGDGEIWVCPKCER